LANCAEDMHQFAEHVDQAALGRLQNVVERDFNRLSYTEAVEILKASGKTFEYPVEWGHNLQAEHERYLAEEKFSEPLVVYDYPASIKPFYMRVNDDGKTVRAMDVLVPGVGEIIGG